MKQFMVFLTMALCLCDAYAIEPLWTEKEREAKRDILIAGEVLKMCPQHAELEKGDKGKFYIVKCTKAFLENLELKEYSKSAFLIPGNSDVVKAVLGKEKKGDNPDAGDGK